jgi:hypothetical protein
MATNYNINYDDKKFAQVESDKQQALTEVEQTYGGMIDQTDGYFQAQIDASKEWADKQQQLQQEQTDFAIEQIEQQKGKAEKDYTKEQSGAYADWQKQSNAYGVNAEQMASGGLTNTGFSESSQVSMYNTYQNRVATARESFNQAVLNYNNSIKEAQLQNNSKQAEIAFQSLQAQLELSLQGFQYKNQLLLEQANKKQEIDNTYYSRYQDVLQQMNQENALAEEVRQYNENLALQKKQLQEEIRQYEQSYALQVKQFDENIRQFEIEIERLRAKDKADAEAEAKRLELQKQQLEQQKAEAQRDYELKQAQLKESRRQFDNSNNGGGGDDSPKIDKGSYEVNTPYYQGSLNSDAKEYGTFSNGYQPKGISGYGKVSKTGKTVQIETKTLSGQKKTVVQNVWKTPDGSTWYWEGRQNKYIKINGGSKTAKTSSSKNSMFFDSYLS